MTVPDFQTIMRPALVALEGGEPRSLQEIRGSVAHALGVDEKDQAQLLPSGKQTTYSNRLAWALTQMAKAELVSRTRAGAVRDHSTRQGGVGGKPGAGRHDGALRVSRVPSFSDTEDPLSDDPAVPSTDVMAASEISPSEAVGQLVQAADTAVAGELLERVLAQPSAFLERLSLRLLKAMGYGGRESLTEHTGRPGDAGLDAPVRQDALGLELVGVQAKRYERIRRSTDPRFKHSWAPCRARRRAVAFS